MRREASVADESRWFTTADLARAVERTPRGAMWIADQEQVPYERTPARQRLYRVADVEQLLKRRGLARLRNVRALRPKRVGLAGEPQQLALFGPRLLRAMSPPDADSTSGVGSTSGGIVREFRRV